MKLDEKKIEWIINIVYILNVGKDGVVEMREDETLLLKFLGREHPIEVIIS